MRYELLSPNTIAKYGYTSSTPKGHVGTTVTSTLVHPVLSTAIAKSPAAASSTRTGDLNGASLRKRSRDLTTEAGVAESSACSPKRFRAEKSALSETSSSEIVSTTGTVTESDDEDVDPGGQNLNASIIPSRECLSGSSDLYLKGTHVVIRNPEKEQKLLAAWVRRVPNYPEDPFYHVSLTRTDHTTAASYYRVEHNMMT